MKNGVIFTLLIQVCFFSGCGYSWQSQSNPWKEKKVSRVFIQMFQNDSNRPGVETYFTSALIREFSKFPRFTIVNSKDSADAILSGNVTAAGSTGNGPVTLKSISKDPKAQETDIIVSADYSAFATINVSLTRIMDGSVLWSQSFSGQRIFPGSNKFGDQGNTSALINRSQEELATTEIASLLAQDVFNAMTESF